MKLTPQGLHSSRHPTASVENKPDSTTRADRPVCIRFFSPKSPGLLQSPEQAEPLNRSDGANPLARAGNRFTGGGEAAAQGR